ncbi:MAG TPA: acyltransferase [Acidimicrobiales bacterium]|nr:acyltransferase [Acidimicrobiales bacterium]
MTRRAAAPNRDRSFGTVFDPARNSLNFLRLALALAVLASHSIPLGGFGDENLLVHTTIGTVAVFGFFAISGYLIAASAQRTSVPRFLWQRCLRIFPAFWVCLIVTAGVIAVIAWLGHGSFLRPHCGAECYGLGRGGAVDYVVHNFLLRMNQHRIAGTPWNVPYPYTWDGSLWTLFYEFVCYLLLGLLALVGLLRRRTVVTVLAVAVWCAAAVVAFGWAAPVLNADLQRLAYLVPPFLAGTLLFLYRDRVPDSAWLAVGFGAAYVATLWLPLGGWFISGPMLFAPLLAYPVLWLGVHLPFQRVGARNDYSYGIYVYAFPVQQLLVVFGLARWGYLPFTFIAVGLTVPLAVASWWAVERNALKLKRARLRVPPVTARGPAPAVTEAAEP